MFIILILLLMTFGCSKNVLTKDAFIEIGSFNGYIIEENKKGYENYAYIKDIYYAINREDAYDIQFLELENDDYAKRFFDINKTDLMKEVDSNTYIRYKNMTNYAVYHIENDTKYMLVIRSNNNILYVTAPIDYINEIEDFLRELDIDF